MLALRTHPLEHVPASFTSGAKWFAFYTYIHAEKLAEKSIRSLGFEVCIPYEKRIDRVRRREWETPVFARYGFVEFDPSDPSWGSITEAKGVVDILRTNNVPSTVPKSFIDGIRLADSMGVFDRTKPPKEGIEVLVTAGPFSDFIGKIKRARAKDRARVLLNILGSEREIEIPLANLREI